jgi:hypothetical protein
MSDSGSSELDNVEGAAPAEATWPTNQLNMMEKTNV